MRRVSLREANQNFSSCVAEVEAGESLILLRRGKPVARIIPFDEEEPRDGPRPGDAARRLESVAGRQSEVRRNLGNQVPRSGAGESIFRMRLGPR